MDSAAHRCGDAASDWRLRFGGSCANLLAALLCGSWKQHQQHGQLPWGLQWHPSIHCTSRRFPAVTTVYARLSTAIVHQGDYFPVDSWAATCFEVENPIDGLDCASFLTTKGGSSGVDLHRNLLFFFLLFSISLSLSLFFIFFRSLLICFR